MECGVKRGRGCLLAAMARSDREVETATSNTATIVEESGDVCKLCKQYTPDVEVRERTSRST